MNQNLINHNSHNGNDEEIERDEELKAIQDEESKVRYDDKSNNDIWVPQNQFGNRRDQHSIGPKRLVSGEFTSYKAKTILSTHANQYKNGLSYTKRQHHNMIYQNNINDSQLELNLQQE